jgi:hypothetical protein
LYHTPAADEKLLSSLLSVSLSVRFQSLFQSGFSLAFSLLSVRFQPAPAASPCLSPSSRLLKQGKEFPRFRQSSTIALSDFHTPLSVNAKDKEKHVKTHKKRK